MGQHNQTYKYQLPINHYHDNSIQFIKSHLSIWGFLCIMIHSSIILAIPCTINLTPKQGLIKPNPNIWEYTEPWKKVGFETLHLSLDLDPDLGTRDKGEEIWTDLEQVNKRETRSGHHHNTTQPPPSPHSDDHPTTPWTSTTTTTGGSACSWGGSRQGERREITEGEREREAWEKKREKEKRSLTARVS